MVLMRVPYPMGYYAKGLDARIDDPNGGWKGRGLWSASGDRTPGSTSSARARADGRAHPGAARSAGALRRKYTRCVGAVNARLQRTSRLSLATAGGLTMGLLPDFVLDYVSVTTFWTILMIVHGLAPWRCSAR
jgi:hypothetical protein